MDAVSVEVSQMRRRCQKISNPTNECRALNDGLRFSISGFCEFHDPKTHDVRLNEIQLLSGQKSFKLGWEAQFTRGATALPKAVIARLLGRFLPVLFPTYRGMVIPSPDERC
jgi:hypothetical protein